MSLRNYKHQRIDAFELWWWRRLLKSPLDSKEIKPVNSKGNQPWIFIGRTDVEAEAFDLCYFSVIPAEPRVPRIPLVLFRDTHDDSMENQETWALSYMPIPNDILSQLISILIETWKRGNDRYEAQHELPGRTLPSNTALSLHRAYEARVHGQE